MGPPGELELPDLKKRYGQHHLLDSSLCRPLVEFLRPKGERVIEVGPGGGVLTRALLAQGARVSACELDLEWAALLLEKSALPAERLGGIRLWVGDAMDLEWERVPSGTLVAGNLPYGIATALIQRLLTRGVHVRRAGFLVQLEVAQRLVAGPGDSDYGAFSVTTRAWCQPLMLGRVAKGSFRPPPKVDGAFVGLRRREPPLPVAEMAAFSRLVRQGFAQRRKTLPNSLSSVRPKDQVVAAMRAHGLDPRSRAQELGLEPWLQLYSELRS